MKPNADLLIFNAKIFINDDFDNGFSCIIVKNGIITEIGGDSLRNQYTFSEKLDAEDSFIYPGFIDAHSHFYGYANMMRYINLFDIKSYESLVDTVVKYAKTDGNAWILGMGWDQNLWKKAEFPDNEILNKLFPETPVLLTRIDGHAVLANEAAIKNSNINFNDFNKTEIVFKNSQPTGVFLENAADKLKNSVPKPTEDEMISYLLKAAENCHNAGLTGVSDAGLNKDEILLLKKLQTENKLNIRIDAWLSNNEENIDYFVKNRNLQSDDFLRIGAIKAYMDGALGSRGAWLKENYSDQNTKGVQVIPDEELLDLCKLAYKYDFQVNTHAIGDEAVAKVLEIYSKVLPKNNDKRWRIEHSQIVATEDLHLFKEYNIIPSIQATHATSDMGWADKRLGERVKNAYRYQNLLKQNGWLPNGTDFPIEDISPLKTFFSSVYRKNKDCEPRNGFQIENALTPLQALKSMTIWAAKATFEENRKGEIKKGFFADFTILNKNILDTNSVNCGNFDEVEVVHTVVNGKIVK